MMYAEAGSGVSASDSTVKRECWESINSYVMWLWASRAFTRLYLTLRVVHSRQRNGLLL